MTDEPFCANGHQGIPMRYSHTAGGLSGGVIYVCPQCGRRVQEYRHPMTGELIISEV